MRVLCKAQQFPGVNIDERMVCESVSWLIQNQRGDGGLPEVMAVVHRETVVKKAVLFIYLFIFYFYLPWIACIPSFVFEYLISSKRVPKSGVKRLAPIHLVVLVLISCPARCEQSIFVPQTYKQKRRRKKKY